MHACGRPASYACMWAACLIWVTYMAGHRHHHSLHHPPQRLLVAFDDGSRFSYPAEYLRVESPSVENDRRDRQSKPLVGLLTRV